MALILSTAQRANFEWNWELLGLNHPASRIQSPNPAKVACSKEGQAPEASDQGPCHSVPGCRSHFPRDVTMPASSWLLQFQIPPKHSNWRPRLLPVRHPCQLYGSELRQSGASAPPELAAADSTRLRPAAEWLFANKWTCEICKKRISSARECNFASLTGINVRLHAPQKSPPREHLSGPSFDSGFRAGR